MSNFSQYFSGLYLNPSALTPEVLISEAGPSLKTGACFSVATLGEVLGGGSFVPEEDLSSTCLARRTEREWPSRLVAVIVVVVVIVGGGGGGVRNPPTRFLHPGPPSGEKRPGVQKPWQFLRKAMGQRAALREI